MNADTAYMELAEAQKAVRASRRAFARGPDSKFVKAMKAAMNTYLDARKAGTSRDDAMAQLEVTLRASWPKAPSKFGHTCHACEDTGVIEHFCWSEQRCGRKVCSENPEKQHAYVTACHCAKGSRFRAKDITPDDAITAAGRTSKRKAGGWRRIGE